jgi:hypothetical protein
MAWIKLIRFGKSVASCTLHKFLLEIDGLSAEWDSGVSVVSNWERALGEMDFKGVQDSLPNAIARLSMNLDPTNCDLSRIWPGKNVVGEIHNKESGVKERCHWRKDER